MATLLTIGALAQASGVKVETIRWYEKVGVLQVARRTSGNYRTYDDEDVRRLTFIRRARDLGFPLDRIRVLLDISGEQTRGCGQVDDVASDQLREVDRKIIALQALRSELAAVIASCPGGGTMADCQIIQALGATKAASSAFSRPGRSD